MSGSPNPRTPHGTDRAAPADRAKRAAIALWAAMALFVLVGPAAGVDIVPLDELKPGDLCVARTVFRGTEIEEFTIEILDVVPGHHPGGSLILGLASGDLVERTGIMQGMSGSPVYLDGRLVGAIAMSWAFSREPIAGITPIEEMLPALDVLDGTTSDVGDPGVSYSRAFDLASGGELSATPIGRLVALSGVTSRTGNADGTTETMDQGPTPVLTPLLVRSGDRAFLAGASGLLEPLGFVPVTAWGGGASSGAPNLQAMTTSAGRTSDPPVMEPGSAVGAQLVSGDISMAAIGTVTYRDGDRILAFGHPLFNAGPVELPMVSARVHASMPSLSVSFKFASGREPVGTFLQDRRRVMAGRLGGVPDMIPMTVRISVDGAAPTTYGFDVVRSASYASLFTGLAFSEAVAEAAQLSGAATAALSVTVETPDGPISYENVFFTEGLPFRVGGEVSSIVELLLLNEFKQSELTKIVVALDVRSERRQSFIEQVTAGRAECAPGDTLTVRIGLRDWQGESNTRVVELAVPRSTAPGPVVLRVAGAAEYHMLEMERLGAGAYPRSYEQVVRAITDVRPENTVVVQLLSAEPGFSRRGRELTNVSGRAALVMSAGAGTGTVDRAEMTVLDQFEFTHDRPIVGVHELQITIVDDEAGAR